MIGLSGVNICPDERIGEDDRPENQKEVNGNGKFTVLDNISSVVGNLARCFSFGFRVSEDYESNPQ